MEKIGIIETNVESLLSDRGLNEEYKEQAVRLLLYHLFVALDIYRYMTVAEKNKAGYWFRLFSGSYTLRSFLKERKRKRDKEKSPLHPSYKKESGVKEKAQKTNERAERDSSDSLETRREAFRQECMSFVGQYNSEQVADFFHYWAEENQKTGKMLFEMEKEKKSWNTKFRLARWNNNQFTSATTAAAIRLQKAKASKQKEVKLTEEQTAVARQRMIENERREQEHEENKKKAVSYEQWLAMKNP